LDDVYQEVGMAALSGSSLEMLRRTVSLRSVFLWLLLGLLLAGAASYTYGSRYAIVPSNAAVQSAGEEVATAVPLPEEVEKDCCERRQAPRSEPAPIRTGVVEPPSLTVQQPEQGMLEDPTPPEPDLPALTVIKLSVSRT
jgi:hypothetical protein